MVNFRSQLRAALSSDDYPDQVAKVFTLPPMPTTKASMEPQRTSNDSEPLEDSGLDWTSVLSLWCDVFALWNAGYFVKCYEAQSTLHSR